MRCLFEFYVPSKKAWVSCGKCHDCRERKRFEWVIRLTHEGQYSETRYFLTLTYDPESLPILSNGEISRASALDPSSLGIQTLWPRDHETFMKRLRIAQRRKGQMSSHKIRYYMTAEYGTGGTARPHYHYILFGLDPKISKLIPEIWNLGHIKIGSVSKASINYVAGHQHKKWILPPGAIKPFTRMSKGLGKEYIKHNRHLHDSNEENEPNGLVTVNGYKHPLPEYYRNKIFHKVQRDYLRDKAIQENDKRIAERGDEDITVKMEAYQDRRRRQLKTILKHKL